MVLAPFAILAFWGSSYLLDCVRTLEAPGVPFKYTLHTKAGDLTVSAQSYVLAIQRGSLYLSRPKLTDPSGVVVAQLDRLEATGLNLTRGASQILRVKGFNLQGRLTRRSNGQFDFEDFIPAQQAGGTPLPFDVDIDRASLQFIDQTGGTPWTCTVSSPRLKVAGLGSDWVANAKAEVSGVGTLNARVQRIAKEGTKITGAAQPLQVASAAKHFLGNGIAALKEASCDSMVVHGPFEVFIPVGKPIQVQAAIEARAIGVHYQKYAASTASFVGNITAEGAVGALDVAEGGCTATFKGSALWKHPQAAGTLIAAVPNVAALPVWSKPYIPKDATFQNGSFSGWVSAKGLNDYHLSGNIEAQSIGLSNRRVDTARLGVEVENDRVVLDVRHAVFTGEPITGIVTIDLKSKAILGSATAEHIDLAGVGALFGYHEVAGDASASVLIDGTLSDPGVDFVTHGKGIATVLKDHTISLGQFEAAGRYANGNLSLRRALFNAPEGLIAAHGSMGATGALGLQVTARGLLVAAYDPHLSGEANVAATVTGTLKDPVLNGRVEGYDLAYKTRTIPAVVADFKVDRKALNIEDVQAAKGTASLTGFGSIQFSSKNLDGSFAIRDVQLADWLTDDFIGAIDVPHIALSGTLSHPIATGQVEGSSMVVRGIKVDKLTATVGADGDVVSLHSLNATGADGSLSAQGDYDLDQQLGDILVTASGLSIAKLAPELSDTVVVQGKVSGKAQIAIRGTEIHPEQGTGQVAGVIVNGSELGGGDWDVHTDGGKFKGNFKVGNDSRFVHLTNATYDPELRRAAGELDVHNFQAEDIVSTAIRYLPDLSIDAKDSLRAVDGLFSIACSFEGTQEDPAIKVSSLQLSQMTYHRQPVGDLNAAFNLDRHKWNLQSLTLANGPASVSMHGTVDEHGETHIDATNDNRFDLSKLSLFDSRLSRLTGTAHLWFSVDGPTKSPRIVASLNVDNLFAPPGLALSEEHDDKYLRFELDKIVIDPSNTKAPAAQMSGIYFYKGFRGTITADAPFEYPFKVADDKPIHANLLFDKSDLKNIAQLVGGLDAARISGTADGHLEVSGTSKKLELTGGVNAGADNLAFNGLDDILKSASLNIVISDEKLTIAANGDPIRGGKISATASIPIESLGQMESKIQKDGILTLLDRPLTGNIMTSDAQFRQHLFGQTSLAATAKSNIVIGGTLRQPDISGDVSFSAGDVVLKGINPTPATPEDHLVDPQFHLTFSIPDPARLRSSTADMMLIGNGTLQGSLQSPKLDASLNVEKGTIRLPAALLRLDQGGSVKVAYGATGPGVASAIVDMEGNTSVTASRLTDTDVQRYDINLVIKGDLLQDNGLTLTATSDPPDLSQERILGILGEADLLTTLSNGNKESSAIQAAMLSSGTMLLDPYTSQVAKGLGLDFLNVEYNAYDQASVNFGLILGAGFSAEGTRQISEPPPGFPSRYDFKLVYRPRRVPGALRRVRLFVGSDQDRPWKVGLEYGVRF